MAKQERFEESRDRKTPTKRSPNSPSGKTDTDTEDLDRDTDRDEDGEEQDDRMRREPEALTGTDPRRRGKRY